MLHDNVAGCGGRIPRCAAAASLLELFWLTNGKPARRPKTPLLARQVHPSAGLRPGIPGAIVLSVRAYVCLFSLIYLLNIP